MKTFWARIGWVAAALVFAACSLVHAGDAPQAGGQGQDGMDNAPGLRMDPVLLDVGMQFLGNEDVGEVMPVGAVSSAEDGYTVQEYRILDAGAAEAGTFYRVRTLMGKPVRDVAVMFDGSGKLSNVFDIRPPEIDDEATKKAKAEAKAVEITKEDLQAFAAVKFKSAPSSAILELMLGMEAAPEAMAITALLKGVVRASNLASGKGVSGEDVASKDKNAFKVTTVLPKKGTPVPTFSYTTVDGKAVSNGSLRGKPFVVFITAQDNLQGLTSADALQRRGAVMMSRVSRWMYANMKSELIQKRFLVVMADKAEDLAKAKKPGDKDQTDGLLVADPDVLKTFGVTVNPMLLVYDRKGNLIEAFSATSPAADYKKALEDMLK